MFKLVFVTLWSILLFGVLAQSIITSDDGLEVYPGSYPWSTYIQILNDDTMNYVTECFGALISPSWVFTSADCGVTAHNTYRLHFGAENFTSSEITMISRNFIIYPTYDPMLDSGLDNVGLIELPSPLAKTDRIAPVALPWELVGTDLTGTFVHFVGRRHIIDEDSGRAHPILRFNVLDIISDEDCDDRSFVRSGRMCTLGTDTNPMQTPCFSMGYIVAYNNLKLSLVGGSNLNSCSESPNYFPRITDYLDWITNVTGIINI